MFFPHFYEHRSIEPQRTECGQRGRSGGREQGEQAFQERHDFIAPQLGLSVHPVHEGDGHLGIQNIDQRSEHP